MSIKTKIQKGWRLLKTINIPQTLWLYFRIKHPRSASSWVYHKSDIHIAKTAKIEMRNGSFLGINEYNVRKKGNVTSFWLADGARLVLNGSFTMFEGAFVDRLM